MSLASAGEDLQHTIQAPQGGGDGCAPRRCSSRIKAFDYLNVISAFAVILLHVSTLVFLNYGDVEWHIAVVYQCACCFAVPVFFMISGANLLGYRERYSTKRFLVRRARRVLVTLFLCSVLFYLFNSFYPVLIGQAAHPLSAREFVNLFMTNGINDVYWFFYTLIGLYLVTPLLSLAAQRPVLLTYLLALSGISTFAVPQLNHLIGDGTLFSLARIDYVAGWVFYYLGGYWLVRIVWPRMREHRAVRSPLPLIAAAVLMVIGMVALTYAANPVHTSAAAEIPYANFWQSESLLVPLYAGCVMLLGLRLFDSGPLILDRCAQALSKYCLGMYAIHMLFINLLDVYVPHRISWDLGLRPLVVFALSLAAAFVGKWALSKISLLVRTGIAALHATFSRA